MTISLSVLRETSASSAVKLFSPIRRPFVQTRPSLIVVRAISRSLAVTVLPVAVGHREIAGSALQQRDSALAPGRNVPIVPS